MMKKITRIIFYFIFIIISPSIPIIILMIYFQLEPMFHLKNKIDIMILYWSIKDMLKISPCLFLKY
jgi:hypothetical protein